MTLWQRSFLRPAAKARITLNKTISVQSLRPFSFSKFFCPKRDLLKQILFWTMVTSQSKKTPLAVISETISLGKRYLSRHFDALLEFSNTIHLFYYLACNFLIWNLIKFIHTVLLPDVTADNAIKKNTLYSPDFYSYSLLLY